MGDSSVVVVGLSRFGGALAVELARSGCAVVADGTDVKDTWGGIGRMADVVLVVLAFFGLCVLYVRFS